MATKEMHSEKGEMKKDLAQDKKMIAGAVKSPKTPKHLKEGLIRKYGTQLRSAGLM